LKKKYKYIIALTLILVALGLGIMLGAVTWIIQETPDISAYRGSQETTRIYSSDGELLSRFFTEDRIYVPLNRMPDDLKKAIIAIEDTNFYSHGGINLWGIARAAVVNIREGRVIQGGSTITQQLARNVLLTLDRTFYRKIQEAYLALQFEHVYTKPEILEMYLNEIFMGHSAYGVQTAAQQYFGKNVWDLSLSESALIAGLPQSPNNYSPLRNPELAIRRRNMVLSRMKDIGFITTEEYESAINEELDFQSREDISENNIVYFENYIRRQLHNKLKEIYGPDGPQMIYGGGLQVYTTLDLDMQKKAEDAYREALTEDGGYIPSISREGADDNLQPQGAVITLDAKTGAIRAMIGGRGNDHFNRAVQAKRQPGSAFKPFVYAAAVQNGYSPASVINDLPLILETDDRRTYIPRNYDDTYRGFISARQGLADSVNVAAVRLANDLGITNVIDKAREMGISTFTDSDYFDQRYSVALGGLNQGVIPLEMASAYSVFANEGIKTEPYAIEKIVDSRDNVIYESKSRKQIILEESSAYMINDMLKSVITDGTGWRINESIDRPVAGKTGTTNRNTDAWFVGYTPELVTAVWIGEDQNRPMNSDFGYPHTIESRHAVMLWRDYMVKVLADRPSVDFEKPPEIISKEIDPVTGLLPGSSTPQTVEEIFTTSGVPDRETNLHGEVETIQIDRSSGQIATDNCPRENLTTRHYLKDSGIRYNNSQSALRISFSYDNPEQGDNFSGVYEIAPYHPVQKIDQETGFPASGLEGEPVYERKPTSHCELHDGPSDYAPYEEEPAIEPDEPEDEEAEEPEETEERSIIQDIWDFLDTRNND